MQQTDLKWKTSSILLIIYLSLFFLAANCNNGKDQKIPDFQPDASNTTPGPISEKLFARIYFDATLSMQGFVVPGSTKYTQMCRYLESIIVSGWRDESVSFFRFGREIKEINRNTYLQVGDESFYQTDLGTKTYIEKIIEKEYPLVNHEIKRNNISDEVTEIDENNITDERVETDSIENRLVVIVTDLFQDDGDINRLIPELKEKCIKKGVDVGLFGFRSQFDGMIYDIGIGEESSMRYESITENPETYRPFYLLVLGRHADISHYFDRLIANGFTDAKTIIFSRYLLSPLLSFEHAKIEKLENLIRDKIAEEPDSRLKEYRIRNRNELSKISTKMKYELLSHTMSFDSNIIEPSIIIEHNRNNSDRSEEIWKTARNCVELKSTFTDNGNDDELIVDFELDSKSLTRRTIYFYKVALHPKIDSYQVPEWCLAWDMGTDRNGAKTLNIVNFVDDLTDIVVNEHKPKIAQLNFCIEKR